MVLKRKLIKKIVNPKVDPEVEVKNLLVVIQ